jgi:hypothetical protein
MHDLEYDGNIAIGPIFWGDKSTYPEKPAMKFKMKNLGALDEILYCLQRAGSSLEFETVVKQEFVTIGTGFNISNAPLPRMRFGIKRPDDSIVEFHSGEGKPVSVKGSGLVARRYVATSKEIQGSMVVYQFRLQGKHWIILAAKLRPRKIVSVV